MKFKLSSLGSSLIRRLIRNNINPDDCLIVSMFNYTSPRLGIAALYEDNKKHEPKKILVDERKNLLNYLRVKSPRVIITLGEEPMRAILNKKGIKNHSGSFYIWNKIPVLPTYDMEHLRKVYKDTAIVDLHLIKAAKQSHKINFNYDSVKIKIAPSKEQVRVFLDRLYHKRTNPSQTFSYDIETIKDFVRCISLAYKDYFGVVHSICIPFFQFQPPTYDEKLPNILKIGTLSEETYSYWSIDDEISILIELDNLFKSDLIKVGHNSISYDDRILKRNLNIVPTEPLKDTMHLWHLLYLELRMGLKIITPLLLNYPNYWSEKLTKSDKSEWTYNCYDSAATLEIYFILIKDLGNEDPREIDLYKKICVCSQAMADATEHGILIDQKRREEIREEQTKKLVQIEKELSAVAGTETFNPRSPKQVAQLLHDKMGLPKSYNRAGSVTTDELTLKKLQRKFPTHSVLQLILDHRKTAKLISSFLSMKLDADGRMRSSFNISGTSTGRMSSSKTVEDTGGNFQNIPVGKSQGVLNVRDVFIPSKGKVLIKADLSQAEALVVAHILTRYNDYSLYDRYNDPDFDIHKWMASIIFDVDIRNVTKDQRDKGKLANHSGNYVAGPNVLVTKAIKEYIPGITYGVAKQILEKRHKAIPGLRIWWQDVNRQLLKTRTLKTCFGRRKIFFDRIDKNSLRSAVAFEPQSIVVDVLNYLITYLYQNVILRNECGFQILIQVHDEIVGECYEKSVSTVVKVIQDYSKIPLPINPDLENDLIIPIDIEVGPNWKDTECVS
ncbi:MAG: DNA polymerase [Candidatus Heimdallarchaeota archaeon]